MARIELRYCTIRLKDGLAGTAAVNQSMTAPMSGDTTLTVDNVALNTDLTTRIPVGARFTLAGETASTTVHTVTARVGGTGTTTAITFSPALTTGTYLDDGVLTFLPIALVIKVGEGDLKYTENHAFKYDKDRGLLDTVRLDDDVPVDLTTSFTYEHITTGTNETVSPVDFIKRRGNASEFVSSATDKCEPFAVDFEITFVPPCGTSEPEVTVFPDFRAEKIEPDFKNSLITLTGKCHATEPLVYRTLQP